MDSQNMNNQNAYAQTAYSQELQEKVALKQLHKGKGTAAIVLGIFSLLGCLGPISFICGIIAIFVGANARKKSKKTTGTAGMVMGIIGVIISMIVTVLFIAMMTGIMAPQMISYTNKVDISSDTMMCDTVKTAMLVAFDDPTLLNDEASLDFLMEYCDGDYYDISVIYENHCGFARSVRDALGIYSYEELCDQLKSKDAETIEFAVRDGELLVRIPGTDIEVN